VVFLADAAATPKSGNAYSALVDWPATAERPEHMLLTRSKNDLDPASLRLRERQDQQQHRGDANLLYVAMTRARQYLYISGCASKKTSADNWHNHISAATEAWQQNEAGNRFHETGSQPPQPQAPSPATGNIDIDPRLSEPVKPGTTLRQIAPSHAGGETPAQPRGDTDGRLRGSVIHKMLDGLTSNHGTPHTKQLATIASNLGREIDDAELQAWWQEARQLTTDPDLGAIYDDTRYQQAFNEVPVQYHDNGQLVYGIIDRLVVQPDNTVAVIDYKTHRLENEDDIMTLKNSYREQMQLYAEAAARLWPDHTIKSYLLFTASHELVACP
jgi:ATP-dependent helicase/nuclease subunit A